MNLVAKIKTYLFKFFVLSILVVGFGIVQGCGGGAGGDLPGDDGGFSPPAPPIEIPSTFSLPEEILDLETLSTVAPAEPVAGVISLSVARGGEFSSEVLIGFELTEIPSELINQFLGGPATVEIPVGTDVTTFETTIVDEFSGEERLIVINFEDYSIDGNGETVGCTGCTCPGGCDKPVCDEKLFLDEFQDICYRTWGCDVEKKECQKGIFGVLKLFPTEDNPGIGSFRVAATTDEGLSSEETFYIGAEYNYFDIEDPFRTFGNAFFLNKSNARGFTQIINASVLQVGLEGVETDQTKLKKTLKASQQVEYYNVEEDPITTFDYFGIFRDDADFWFGTVVGFVDRQGQVNLVNQCVDLRTGDGADPLNCVDLNIDDSEETFLGLPPESFINGNFLNDVPDAPPAQP